ncbi:MAG: FliM/FliN family flagellar motor switch protein, partial [Planctomycetia bacterium]|nr:FliM/FliN family flagellar motor switch protein [Planctomycetia bacterium]
VADTENTSEMVIFTAESLLETESTEKVIEKPEEIGYPVPFTTDFSLEVDVLAAETLKIRADETRVMEISVPVSVLIGRAKRSVAEILGWKIGDVVNLGQKTEETSEVFVNGGCAGRGFPVEWENRVGIQWMCREK